MFLRKLTITDNIGNVCREITFKKGMNIILGRYSADSDESTNSLGKTTVLRAIDFCLGGNVEQFYQDTENKASLNVPVKEFFETRCPEFQLSLSSRFESDEMLLIKRKIDLSTRKHTQTNLKTTNFIDGKRVDAKDFEHELKKRIFNFSDDKPTLRQLLPKFIRIKDDQISNILKFSNKYTTDEEYEKIHLLLFGYDKASSLEKKSTLERELSKKQKALTIIGQGKSISTIEQTLNLLVREKEELEEKRTNYEIDEQDVDGHTLELAQKKLSSIKSTISEIHLNKHISEQRLARIKETQVNDSSEEIQLLYDEAKHYTQSIAITFDALVLFHNKMLQDEIGYLEGKIDQFETQLQNLNTQKIESVANYNESLQKLGNKGSLAEYTKISFRIDELSIQVGKNSAWLEDLKNAQAEVENAQQQLNQIQEDFNELSAVDENLKKFNEIFSKYSEQLFGEKYFVSYKKVENKSLIKFSVNAMAGNEGSGHKQGVVAAFDLAYTAYSNLCDLYRPKFAMQDKAELIDQKRWMQLFNLANEQNGQYIAPFIYDKLANDFESIKENIILELYSENKFFGI